MRIIADRLKPALSKDISTEQFGFVPRRQIMDVVGIVQESLHYIKKKKFSDFILKLDLEKAYDRIDWTFLRLVLM